MYVNKKYKLGLIKMKYFVDVQKSNGKTINRPWKNQVKKS